MKKFIKGITLAVFVSTFVVNCAQKNMDGAGVTETTVVETEEGNLQTIATETGTPQVAPSNNLPMEKVDIPSNLLSLLTPPTDTSVSSGGFLSGLFGGGSTCSMLSSILGIGASFLTGGNPILGMVIPQLANSLLNCGASSSLTNLIPNGSSDNQQIFALLSQIMQAQSQGKDPFALINAIKNPNDLSSIIGIVTQLVGQSGNGELTNILGLLTNFQSNFGSSIGQCGNMNAMACQVFQIVNQIRTKKGLQSLIPSIGCTLAAQSHSKDMFENSIFTHLSSTGLTAKARFEQFGLKAATENIVKGEKLTAQQAVEMWMSSQSHLSNILNGSFTGGGVGFLNGYFTQCFTK